MSKTEKRSTWVEEIIKGLRSFAEAVESGEPISGKFTVREVARTTRPESPPPDKENSFQGSK